MEINKQMTRTHRAAATSRYALLPTAESFLVGPGGAVSATGVVRVRDEVSVGAPCAINESGKGRVVADQGRIVGDAPFFTTRVIRSASVEPILT